MFCGQDGIGVSDCTTSFGNNSWNGIYNAEVESGELKLFAAMSFTNNQGAMTSEDVVVGIWENYIHAYLERN